jgi:hypothetical protein
MGDTDAVQESPVSSTVERFVEVVTSMVESVAHEDVRFR